MRRSAAALVCATCVGIAAPLDAQQPAALVLPHVGARVVPEATLATWSVQTLAGSGGAPDSDLLVAVLPGGGEVRIGINRLKPGSTCAMFSSTLQQNGTGKLVPKAEFEAPAGWLTDVLRHPSGMFLLCHEETPQPMVAVVTTVGSVSDVPGVARSVLAPLVGKGAAAADAAAAKSERVVWGMDVVLALPGGTDAWTMEPGSQESLVFTRRAAGRRLALQVAPVGEDITCESTIGLLSRKMAGTRVVDDPLYLPDAYYPHALVANDSVTHACLYVLSGRTWLVIIGGDVTKDAPDVARALRAIATALKTRRTRTSVPVRLANSSIAFTIPPAGWSWNVSPLDSASQVGISMGAIGEGERRLVIVIRGVPSSQVDGCMFVPSMVSMQAMQGRTWIPDGYSQYWGRRGDTDAVACLVREGMYYLAIVRGDLNDPSTTAEAARILKLLRDAS